MTTSATPSTSAPEAIFIPIDLEASLGRIEEIMNCNGMNSEMDCDQQLQHPTPPPPHHNTRTSSRTPFTSQDDTIAPYPISETDDEIKERQRLSESVGNNWTIVAPHQSHTFDDHHSMMEVTATESPLDNDDFSLTEDGANSLAVQEDLQLERIDDPISFWEENIIPTSNGDESFKQLQQDIPFSVSFSYEYPGESSSSMEW
ncbi:hypothetical protein IV203_024243 [Nitzschia inconspicua]|uniref:Uncharacterized protein n=1 Tax=Nitzschia inconspicua TaxID=303405 RepID=A0A9K3KBM6_9STRA|nr:hypothetical protein IV203_024243 [Nitzschia inconspicua]